MCLRIPQKRGHQPLKAGSQGLARHLRPDALKGLVAVLAGGEQQAKRVVSDSSLSPLLLPLLLPLLSMRRGRG